VIVALKVKTLTTIGVPRRFTYRRLALGVSSGVLGLGCSPVLRMSYVLKDLYLVRMNEHCSLDVWPQTRSVPRYTLIGVFLHLTTKG